MDQTFRDCCVGAEDSYAWTDPWTKLSGIVVLVQKIVMDGLMDQTFRDCCVGAEDSYAWTDSWTKLSGIVVLVQKIVMPGRIHGPNFQGLLCWCRR